ncbi:MAG TPA: protein kinase [Pyrinomonadaceae bacterium]|nr:protein kinase [Pyrinomonadaceae bacterium]
MEQISHYRILKRLGAGGMGEVYLAEDMKLGRKVAIKVLSDEYTTNKDRLKRFEQEACSASALNHPNILTIYEVGNDNGRHFIATEFIDGITLRQKLVEARLDPREILDIAVQVAAALEEAHGVGIVHRDIKPDNIMVRRNGYVKVLDFGLAKLTESSTDRTPSDGEAATRVLVHTDAGVVMGTSHYMSPEQARGKPVDARADIWSLGVVMYQMVTERLPFEGETATDVLVAITQKEPAPIARFDPNVPAELEWIVMKALRKAKDERYQTIKELITDLRRLRQKLEFEVELERTAAPESFTRSSISPVAQAPTVSGKVTPTVTKGATTMSSAEYIVTGIRRHRVAAMLIGVIVVAGIIAAVVHFNRAQPLTDKDTVLLADFVNTTGETVFDGTLKQALSVQLAQSPFLNIFPEERVRETLRYMNRSSDERVTRDVGLEICRRQGLKALLIGSISSLGSNYVITLEAVNAQTGDSIAREQTEANSKEKVLSSLGAATSSLRQKLGESLSSIQKYDVPVEQATTSSLEALKAFTMGNEERAKGKPLEALGLYQSAISLDPNFAMAYARIAVFYGNTGQLEKAKEYVKKAYELKDRVSERERLYISEKYYGYITGEIPKVIEVLETTARLYPQDYVPHNNLALQYLLLGRFEDARKEAQVAVRLSPSNISALDNLIGAFLALGRFDEAQQIANQLNASHPEAAGEFNNVVFAYLRNDWTTINAQVESVRGKPQEPDLLSVVAQAYFSLGQVSKAEELSQRAIALFMKDKRIENVAGTLLNLAGDQSLLGKCQEAKQNATAALAQSRGRTILGNAALTFAVCGDIAQSQSLLDEMAKNYPLDTASSSLAAPVVRAVIERSRGNYEQAIRFLETVRTYDMSFIIGSTNNYQRGYLYLDLKKGAEARREFQTILDKRGCDLFSPARSLAYLGLARAAAMSGDTAASRKAYQDFFALWKEADANLAPLVEARKEYEKLTS